MSSYESLGSARPPLRQHGGVAPLVHNVSHRHPAPAVVPGAVGVFHLGASGHAAADPNRTAADLATASRPAGSLNALDFPVQLLVRQHPPVLQGLRSNLAEAQPDDLPKQTRDAAESLGRLLTGLESHEGILDRRFYPICEHSRADELRGLLARAGLGVFPLKGPALRLLLLASALGGSPDERDEDAELAVEINRRDIRVGGQLTRSRHMGKWPRSLAPGFLQGLMAAGAPMDLSIHLGAIPSEQAARTLEWQKVRFESAQSLSLNRGRSLSPEA